MIHLYGIPNCDTVKKARVWLEAQGHAATFHDYKKEGADPAKIAAWIAAAGLDVVVNRKGTTYRALSDADKALAASETATALEPQNAEVLALRAAVLFKLDKEGYGDLFEQNKLHTNQTLSFASWTEDQFKLFCCLAGCDYMPSLRNFGIKTAYKVVHKHKTLARVLDHLLSAAASSTSFEGCLATRLEQALLTFKHQTIYNPETKQTEPLTPLPLHLTYLNDKEVPAVSTTGVRSGVQRSTLNPSEVEFAFLGPLLDPQVAVKLVKGEIEPRTIRCAVELPASSVAGAAEGGSGADGEGMDVDQDIAAVTSSSGELIF